MRTLQEIHTSISEKVDLQDINDHANVNIKDSGTQREELGRIELHVFFVEFGFI